IGAHADSHFRADGALILRSQLAYSAKSISGIILRGTRRASRRKPDVIAFSRRAYASTLAMNSRMSRMLRVFPLLSLVAVLTTGAFAQTELAVINSYNRGNELKQAFRYDEADLEYKRSLNFALRVYGEEHK